VALSGKRSDNQVMARFAPLVVAVVIAAPWATPTASADVFKLFGEAHGGGMYGKGTSGQLADTAFFNESKGATYGALVGAELLFADALIQHHQYVNGDGLRTFTQFGLGIHFTIDLGSEQEQRQHEGGYAEIGAALYYGIATGSQVHPPLDKAQVIEQAGIAEARIGFGKHLSNVFDIGIVVPVQYGYFIRDTAGAANNLNTHYQGWEVEGLLALRANIRLL
jgi:hypothetical protein